MLRRPNGVSADAQGGHLKKRIFTYARTREPLGFIHCDGVAFPSFPMVYSAQCKVLIPLAAQPSTVHDIPNLEVTLNKREKPGPLCPDLSDEPVRTFQAFTSDLHRMAYWLIDIGIKTVTMESTGVYWVAAYEVLESRGLDVILANAHDAQAVPGRKSDVNDAQWLQRLHACRLLCASFRPGRDIAALQVYLCAVSNDVNLTQANDVSVTHLPDQARTGRWYGQIGGLSYMLPELLHGLSSGDFELALRGCLGRAHRCQRARFSG